MPSQPIPQALAGAITVRAPDGPAVRDEVIFMSEIGHETEGDSVPPFIMNGLGLPGGEHALEAVFKAEGFDGVAAPLNKTVPALSAPSGGGARPTQEGAGAAD